MNTDLFTTLSTLITIALAFALVYHFWQQYVVDATRHQLFELRDQIFDMATIGKLDRDGEPYQIIREMFNSSIRFAHKMNLVHVLFVVVIFKITKKEPIRSYAEKVTQTIDSIDDTETKNQVWYILRQMHLILAWHLIRVSPMTLIFVILGMLLELSISTIQATREKFGDLMNGVAYSDAIHHCHSLQH